MKRSNHAGLWVGLGTVIVLVIVVVYVFALSYRPAYSDTRYANGAETVSTLANGQKTIHLNLNIVQQVGVGPHADWLGYQTRTATPHPGTVFDLPAGSLVTVSIHNFDSRTALRNTFFSEVQGTVGGTEVADGKTIKVMSPDLTSHTFTIPDFGVTVPMEGIPSNAKANAFETMTFTFRTPNKKGVYRWQCIVPCGSGLYGFGGPMQEIGYMDGWITVT